MEEEIGCFYSTQFSLAWLALVGGNGVGEIERREERQEQEKENELKSRIESRCGVLSKAFGSRYELIGPRRCGDGLSAGN